jgi:hypothetical protein
MDDNSKRILEKYEHTYCSLFRIDCEYKELDDDLFDEDDCPVTYKQFIFAIERLIDHYKENGLGILKYNTLRQNATYLRNPDNVEYLVFISDTLDDLKKTLETIIKQRIVDGLDVELGTKILQDISKI